MRICWGAGPLERSGRGPAPQQRVWQPGAGGGGSAARGGLALSAPLLESVAVALHLQDVDMMGEPVEQGAGEAFGAEHFRPFLKRQVRGDDRRAGLGALAGGPKEKL